MVFVLCILNVHTTGVYNFFMFTKEGTRKVCAYLNERRESVDSLERGESVVVCSQCCHLPTSTRHLRHLSDTSTCEIRRAINRARDACMQGPRLAATAAAEIPVTSTTRGTPETTFFSENILQGTSAGR